MQYFWSAWRRTKAIAAEYHIDNMTIHIKSKIIFHNSDHKRISMFLSGWRCCCVTHGPSLLHALGSSNQTPQFWHTIFLLRLSVYSSSLSFRHIIMANFLWVGMAHWRSDETSHLLLCSASNDHSFRSVWQISLEMCTAGLFLLTWKRANAAQRIYIAAHTDRLTSTTGKHTIFCLTFAHTHAKRT